MSDQSWQVPLDKGAPRLDPSVQRINGGRTPLKSGVALWVYDGLSLSVSYWDNGRSPSHCSIFGSDSFPFRGRFRWTDRSMAVYVGTADWDRTAGLPEHLWRKLVNAFGSDFAVTYHN